MAYLSNPTLEAINFLLNSIGLAPITSLDDDTSPDVAAALQTLESTSRNIQSYGWRYNTLARTLTPDKTTKLIQTDDAWLMITDADTGYYYQTVENRLLNPVTNNYFFTSSINVKIIIYTPYDNLPIQARELIKLQAAIAYQAMYMGDANVDQALRVMAATAKRAHKKLDLIAGPINALNMWGFSASGVSDL